MTRSISPSWLSWVMELRLLQEPGLGVTEETEETEEELEEPLGSTAVLVKPDGLCQLQQMEGTGEAGEEEEEREVSKHPQPNL